MPYVRDNKSVLRGCSLVLLVAAAPLLLVYVFLTSGFSVPIECVVGQESHLRSTLKVELPDENLGELEQALVGIAERREMTFRSRTNPPLPSGQSGVSFHLCSREAYLFASRDRDDKSSFTIHISQAASASDEQAALLEADAGAWIVQRRGR